MTAKSAAKRILEETGKPLHYQKITDKILEQGYWKTEGQTPEATINAQLALDIKLHGTTSPFQRTAPGTFALRPWGLPEYEVKSTQTSADESSTLSFTDAAEHILNTQQEKRPMHYKQITEQALEQGLIQTEGKTPAATMYAQILTEIKRVKRRGEVPRFVKHGQGYVGLRKWMGEGLAFQIERQNRTTRKKYKQRLMSMPPEDFEALVGQLLGAIGFEDVQVTSKHNDGGIDVRGTLVVGDVIRTTMAVQVKRWKNNVQAPTVQQVRGSLGTHEQGLIITTSGFSAGAKEEAARPDAIPVALMDGDRLVRLLIEQDIGVERHTYDLIELGNHEDTAD